MQVLMWFCGDIEVSILVKKRNMEFKAKELAEVLGGTVEGDPEKVVTDFARIESGKPGTLCFYANPKYEHYVYTSKADIIIVNNDFKPSEAISATLIRVPDAYTAIASLLDFVSAKNRKFKRHRGIFATWSLFTTKFGKKVYLGSHSHVGRFTKIGDCTKIYENVYIGDNVRIGSHCIIYPGVKIYSNMVIGNNVILHSGVVIGGDGFGFAPLPDGSYKKIEHTGNVIINDDVEIGANTTIDKSQVGSTIIGKGVKIDNLCQIAHNVEVGEHTVICAQTGIAGSSKIGKYCVLAGQVGIAGHLTIADHTTFGAQSGCMSSVKKEGQQFFGTPAIPYYDFMRSYVVFKKQGADTKKRDR